MGRPKKVPSGDTTVLDTEVPVAKKVIEITPDTNLTNIKTGKVKKGEYSASITTDYYGHIDPFYLSEKDPDFEYRFLRAEEKNLSMKTSDVLSQKGGWQICPKEHLLRIGISEDRLFADGLYRKGDTVLAFMPKELFAKKEEYKRKEAKSRTDGVKRMIGDPEKNIKGKGIPGMAGTGHKTIRGIETKEQLGGEFR